MAESEPAPWLPLALDPAGPFARPLADASLMLFAMGASVLFVVLIALALALFAPEPLRRFIAGRPLVLIGGLAFPVIVLSAVLWFGLASTARLSAPPDPTDLRIRVIGEMWWWRVLYLEGDRILFETANEIRIPANRTIAFELESADVIHSFWVPQLGAKLDMIPGRRNVLRLEADAPGVYRGQCTEYCGAAHALMAFEVVALEPQAFEAWRASQVATSATPAPELFNAVGCGACHSVRGTEANGAMGPDLTHFTERRTLAAGVLPNDPQTLRRWLRNAGEMKPGVRMPSYERLSDQEVDALAVYLESLH